MAARPRIPDEVRLRRSRVCTARPVRSATLATASHACSAACGLLRRARTNQAHRLSDASCACFRLPGFVDRLDVLSLMAEAQLPPPVPSGRLGLQSAHELSWCCDHPLLGVQRDLYFERLAALEPCGFPIAAT